MLQSYFDLAVRKEAFLRKLRTANKGIWVEELSQSAIGISTEFTIFGK